MRLLPPLAALAVSLTSSSGWAHHPGAVGGPDGGLPRSRVALQLAAARFDAYGRQGLWRSESLTLEHVLLERLSIAAQLGAGHVAFRDGPLTNGPTDSEIRVGAIVLGGRNSRVGMAVSVGVEMPTGKPENGLGDGHFSGTTSLTLSVVPSTRWRVSLLLLDHLALGEPKVVDPSPERIPSPSATPQHLGSSPPVSNDPGALKPIAYGSVIGPHHAHELRARPSISYIWGPAYASVGAEVVGIVTEGGAWGPIALNAELGAYAIESVRVAFGGELAVGGEKRLPWQLSLRTEYLF